MATRYSGTLRMRITYVDAAEAYKVTITERCGRLDSPIALRGLRLPAAYRGAVDSADAYDRVARAALGFASADHEAVLAYAAEASDGGFYVQRAPRCDFDDCRLPGRHKRGGLMLCQPHAREHDALA